MEQKNNNFELERFLYEKRIKLLEKEIESLNKKLNIFEKEHYDNNLIMEKNKKNIEEPKDIIKKWDCIATGQKILEEISNKWNYYLRCMDYLYIDPELENNSFIDDFDWNKIVINPNKTYQIIILKNILKIIKKEISSAHKSFNEDLMKKDYTKYNCPIINCSFNNSLANNYKEDVEPVSDKDLKFFGCFAYCTDNQTRGCGKKVYWNTSDVNFLNDFSLDNKKIVGKLVELNKNIFLN